MAFARAYLDDIIVVSSDTDEHLDHLEQLFSRIEEYGFRVRPQKCAFMLPSLTYLGCTVDKNGRRPDTNKITAITRMPPPHDRSSLQSFLGLVNYYNTFVPQMYELRAPLNALLVKDAKWVWSPKCQMAFEKIKKTLTSDLLLTHYDPKLPIIVAADASQHRIGAVLLHKFPDGCQKAVTHISRTLTPNKKHYSQIEKEGLVLVFAV